MCATCPHQQISEQLLIQYFYEGLMLMDKSMIGAASGGTLMDKTHVVAKQLISNMATNYQQFGTIVVVLSRVVANEVSISMVVDNQRLENKLIELASLMRQLAIGQHQNMMTTNQPRLCGIYCASDHPTDACSTL